MDGNNKKCIPDEKKGMKRSYKVKNAGKITNGYMENTEMQNFTGAYDYQKHIHLIA